MTLYLLIDTCVWLDMAKDVRQLPLLDAVFAMTETDEVELILPQTLLDEFGRNRDRVMASSRASFASHFKRVREALVQFAPEGARVEAMRQINEVDHRIATGDGAVNEAVGLIEKIFASTDPTPLTIEIKARATDRGLAKIAPFHRTANGTGDAVIIETYVDALAGRSGADDIYAFVTHNTADFSDKAGDTRLPHPDLAQLFDGTTSRYVTSLGPLLKEFADDLIEESTFDREFSQDPRALSELQEAEHTLFQQVWYNRKWVMIDRVERGVHRQVTQAEWDSAKPKERQAMTIDTVWAGMLTAMKRTEEELGPDKIGPWDDFEWGMLNGKLSALRWVMGDEWDMLDT